MSEALGVDARGALLKLTGGYAALAQSQRLHFIWGSGGSARVGGLVGSSLSYALAGLSAGLSGVLVYVGEDDEDAAYLYTDLLGLDLRGGLYYFPSSYRGDLSRGVDAERAMQRMEVVLGQDRLRGLCTGGCVVSTSLRALGEAIVDSGVVSSRSLRVRVGEELDISEMTRRLEGFGMSRSEFVYEPGQYARRGGIVDVFPLSSGFPYRFDFLGEHVRSIRQFDVETQLSTGDVVLADVVWYDGGVARGTLHVFDFLPPGSVLVGRDFSSGLSAYGEWLGGVGVDGFLSEGALGSRLRGYPRGELGVRPLAEGLEVVMYSTFPQPSFKRNFGKLSESIRESHGCGRRVYISSDQGSQLARLRSIFDDLGVSRSMYGLLEHGVRGGFSDRDLGVDLYTDHELFDRYHRYRVNRSLSRGDSLRAQDMRTLRPGDYVVHVDHGVGIFEGLVRKEERGVYQEYVCLSYRDRDTLLVRIHNLHRLSRYRGKEGVAPVIHKLGSGAWSRMKERAKGKMKDLARDLIRLYARRRASEGFAYSRDGYLQEALEASFLYQDTADQLAATRAVKGDMERAVPMDRLICGDVGFGKTEVAIRAAFKAVTDGKQVAVLVPTLVLALQHYRTFCDRLSEFPCRVELLSRMRTAREQREVLLALREGRVDIVIGTHALLRAGEWFKDLGLLIIDEEQKFGVSAKERLKHLRANLDTLTLTATPIPRTLQFSLLGARDISVISTPPPNRHPIRTEVLAFDGVRIARAIRYELQRGGQVFFIHNRVGDLEDMYRYVRGLVPEARVAMAHGQMSPSSLESVMVSFMGGEYDVLVSTSIVESGLDIPGANTILINNAHHFGLSDLHQLRGRVGRRNTRAYCYALIPVTEALTREARARLRALEEFSELGSGMRLAMQDLDIRGAGNLLGSEQSGFIVDLGFETYHRILDEAVHELKREEFGDLFTDESADAKYVRSIDCVVESDQHICLPEDFVASASERMRLYQDLDRVSDMESLSAYASGLRDRFGTLPVEAESLLGIPPLKWSASSLGIERVILREGLMTLQFVRPLSSPFYGSDLFGAILSRVSGDGSRYRLRQRASDLRLEVRGVDGVESALSALRALGGV